LNHLLNTPNNPPIFFNQCDVFFHNHHVSNPLSFSILRGRMFGSIVDCVRMIVIGFEVPWPGIEIFHLLFSRWIKYHDSPLLLWQTEMIYQYDILFQRRYDEWCKGGIVRELIDVTNIRPRRSDEIEGVREFNCEHITLIEEDGRIVRCV
jgi:hypothetical protein